MRARVTYFIYVLVSMVGLGLLAGCQISAPPSKAKMVEYRERIDESGLTSPITLDDLRVSAALPNGWLPMALQKSVLFIHQQWRSPSRRTAVGATYIRMPLPLSAKTLAWFAKGEATKRLTDAHIIREWTDSLGREWFEAEDARYHMIGYAMTSGFDAWINYTGYRIREPQEPMQIELASKSLDTFLPLSVTQPR